MKNIARQYLLLLTLAATPAFAQAPAAADTSKPSFDATSKVTRYSTVLAVDTTSRLLTLRSQEGDTLVVPVKPEVKTLHQLKKGDRIKAVYTEQLNIRVETVGDVDMTVERMRSDAKPGANPSVTLTERTIYKATIASIDLTKGTAMLKDPSGEESEVTPLKPENLTRVKVGDIVVITAMQTVAMSLDKDTSKKAPAKKAAPKK